MSRETASLRARSYLVAAGCNDIFGEINSFFHFATCHFVFSVLVW
jgi:hypothetical protein